MLASQDVDCILSEVQHGTVQRSSGLSLPPSAMGWGSDSKHQTCRYADVADTLDAVYTSDDDEETEAPASSVGYSEGLQHEQDDDLVEPAKVVPDVSQLKQDYLREAAQDNPVEPMYVSLPPSSYNLPHTVSSRKSHLSTHLGPTTRLVGSSQNNDKIVETCMCGRDYALDANFCQICGEPRLKADLRMGLGDHKASCGLYQHDGPKFEARGDQDDQDDQGTNTELADLFRNVTDAKTVNEIRTFTISGIPQSCSAKDFRDIILGGFEGAIDYLHTPCDRITGVHMNLAIINLVDASHAPVLRWALKCSFSECEMVPAQVQGYKACIMFWGPIGDIASVNVDIKQQFQKTRMCSFFQRGKCLRGEKCVYAHSHDELQQSPDLTKTRLCQNFLHHNCFELDCKFAHGQDELRSTNGVYKTVLCRWSTKGLCKIGAACRFAHAPEELRPFASGPTPKYRF